MPPVNTTSEVNSVAKALRPSSRTHERQQRIWKCVYGIGHLGQTTWTASWARMSHATTSTGIGSTTLNTRSIARIFPRTLARNRAVYHAIGLRKLPCKVASSSCARPSS
eukprot:894747-Pyramimonas_sp.AAC.1